MKNAGSLGKLVKASEAAATPDRMLVGVVRGRVEHERKDREAAFFSLGAPETARLRGVARGEFELDARTGVSS